MARAAEEAAAELAAHALPCYVIGTEVPVPGGVQENETHVSVTTAADVAETIAITRQAFLDEGLADAWTRVIAVVAQPGVEFGDTLLAEYDPAAAQGLARLIADDPQLIFEAHSTDYQTPVCAQEPGRRPLCNSQSGARARRLPCAKRFLPWR